MLTSRSVTIIPEIWVQRYFFNLFTEKNKLYYYVFKKIRDSILKFGPCCIVDPSQSPVEVRACQHVLQTARDDMVMPCDLDEEITKIFEADKKVNYFAGNSSKIWYLASSSWF